MLKYNFESNSQPPNPKRLCFTCWELYAKVQFWKQFTTGIFNAFSIYCVGNYMLKYNFESNSQLEFKKSLIAGSWELYAKVQFWKQFTTHYNDYKPLLELGIIC